MSKQVSKQASKQASLSELLSEYSERKRASGASVRVYEREKIFRLYLNNKQASELGLASELVNKQGFISLNKLSASERKQVRARVAEYNNGVSENE